MAISVSPSHTSPLVLTPILPSPLTSKLLACVFKFCHWYLCDLFCLSNCSCKSLLTLWTRWITEALKYKQALIALDLALLRVLSGILKTRQDKTGAFIFSLLCFCTELFHQGSDSLGEQCWIHDLQRGFSWGTRNQAWSLKRVCVAEFY